MQIKINTQTHICTLLTNMHKLTHVYIHYIYIRIYTKNIEKFKSGKSLKHTQTINWLLPVKKLGWVISRG